MCIFAVHPVHFCCRSALMLPQFAPMLYLPQGNGACGHPALGGHNVKANTMATTATTATTATNANTTTAGKTAPAPAAVVVAGAALYTYQPYNGATNMGWPAGQRGHRAFACQVAQACAKAHPGGFTLAQYRAALVASAGASTLPLPKGGWQRHNMPQWAAAQKWLVPVAAAKA